MIESTTPLRIALPPTANIDAILRERLRAEPGAVLAEVRRDRAWEPVTVAEFNDKVVAVAKGLVALGVEPGDTVGIMSRTRYEWTLLDFAAWAAGAVPVPIYETSSAEQVRWILSNSGVSLLVVETAANAATVAEARDGAPMCREVLVLDGPAGSGAVEVLTTAGAGVADAEIERRRRLATLDDLATIIYTSGTTGRPKGAELTHGNFATLALNTVADVPEVFNGQGRTMLFLPLAHVFARFIEVVAVAGGSVLGHSPDIKTLTLDLRAFRPTYVLGVPRVFEKVYNAAEQSSAAEKARGYFNWATAVAIAYSRALDTPRGPSLWLRFQHVFADGLVYSKLRDTLGGKVTHAVSGGGPLGERLGHFFRGVGLNILEGYGLTETTAPTSVNRPGRTRIGSVGPMMPGCSARIADDGEILLKGPHVFRGYHGNPQATAEAFDGEWFRTGDLGVLDDGYLRITGRKKELIITAGGKNVAPAVLEDRVRAHALVSQCVVVGDNRPFIGALLTIDPDGLAGWLTMHGKPRVTVEQALADPDVIASLDKAVARANEAVSKAESIRKFTVLPGDFTIENGYLTPSMKVKRALVLADFADDVDRLYAAGRDRQAALTR
ncbi:long-chain fatty acid--CoA ligase [Xylanimonas allomyrinae]|uniref:Acyl-CoA synthetase n=1 Tax=Xylanimonas allomyrinae TaxID=2509459 RepID=A0A4P6ELG2_9MICO|nr:AMP-dependent synthetase/ligase [Xylanimonas allomyrinae]QAY62533.1 long-chain fatty acid--CoA ligase [Xylanimonas allomyrinae]